MSDAEMIGQAVAAAIRDQSLWLGAANAVFFGLAAWLGRVWLARIREDARRETEEALVQLQAGLNKDREQTLEVLRTHLGQARDAISQAIATRTMAQSAFRDKQLQAFEALWKAVVVIRDLAPLGAVDILTESEFGTTAMEAYRKGLTRRFVDDTALKAIEQASGPAADLEVFVPREIWYLFFTYRLTVARAGLLASGQMGPPKLWYRDSTLRQMIEAALDKSELMEFDGMLVGKLAWYLGKLESRMVSAVRRHAAGEFDMHEVVRDAEQLDAANRAARLKKLGEDAAKQSA